MQTLTKVNSCNPKGVIYKSPLVENVGLRYANSILMVLLSIGVLGGCSVNRIENPIARKLDLDGGTTRRYHYLAEHPFGSEIVRPAFIIAVEKSPKEKVHGPNGTSYDEYIQVPEGSRSDHKEQLKLYKKIKSGDKDMLVTHIAGYGLVSPEFSENRRFLYNIYPNFGSESTDQKPTAEGKWARQGWLAIKDNLSKSILAEIKKGNYSHVIMASMGWDNDQVESINNYNALIGNLVAAAQRADKQGEPFRPLLIGFTWPSVWGWPSWFDLGQLLQKLISYPVKADDADEIGITIANWLVNDLGRQIKAQAAKTKIIAIGHSFGARLISRAVFSGPFLKGLGAKSNESPVDLLVGLQGAFSVNRFIAGEGDEGAPYEHFPTLTSNGLRILMTWSSNDTANPLSTWVTGSPHVGGKYGHQTANTHRDANALFKFLRTEKGAPQDSVELRNEQRIIYVDATSIVKDHNDVFDFQMADFLWSMIQELAPATKL